MSVTPVIAILDVGKTNKKILLFDESYKIVLEETQLFTETADEEGESCEDLHALTDWVRRSVAGLYNLKDVGIRAVNVSAYGASFVHLGQDGQPLTPLYSYLKPYPEPLLNKFYAAYGGEVTFSMLTASPVLGSLNSGMQLYRLKEERPELFAKIKCSLHLPQYLSYLLTGKESSEITSVGCHTNLWNYSQHQYHEWVYREGIIDKLAPLLPSTSVLPLAAGSHRVSQNIRSGQNAGSGQNILPGQNARPAQNTQHRVAGIGLHDSSAAIIPYLESFREPFVLISTGTWCISMNPFNHSPLTVAELKSDCLCYMSYQGKPVKASRLFAGHEHEQQVRRLADHFNTGPDYYTTITFDPDIVRSLQVQEPAGAILNGRREPGYTGDGRGQNGQPHDQRTGGGAQPGRGDQKDHGIEEHNRIVASVFSERDLGAFDRYEQAYHRLLMDIMEQQKASTQLVLEGMDGGGSVRRIFVDGGFGRNSVYMHLLAAAFPRMEIFAASIPQATAMGAALAIRSHWNARPLSGDIIEYSPFYSKV